MKYSWNARANLEGDGHRRFMAQGSREATEFTLGKILSRHFWYTNFWVPDPRSPAPPPRSSNASLDNPPPLAQSFPSITPTPAPTPAAGLTLADDPAVYHTMAEAVQAAPPGAHIRLLPGVHAGLRLVNPAPGLRVASADAARPAEVRGAGGSAVLAMNAVDCTFADLVLWAPGHAAVETVMSRGIRVSGCVLQNVAHAVSDPSHLVCPRGVGASRERTARGAARYRGGWGTRSRPSGKAAEGTFGGYENGWKRPGVVDSGWGVVVGGGRGFH